MNTTDNTMVADISFWQDSDKIPGTVDFTKMLSSGIVGVVIRAGQGAGKDIKFDLYWTNAKVAGIPRGSYWFYDSRVEPKHQANVFFLCFKGDFPELGLWCDYEENYNGAYKGWKNFKIFIEELKRLTSNLLIGVYTGPDYWKNNSPLTTTELSYFRQYPLWIAHYGVITPTVPEPWMTYLFWQFTSKGDGTAAGVESLNIDLEVFNGSKDRFRQFFNLPPVVIPPETGDNMTTILQVNTTGLNGRSSPNGPITFPTGFKSMDILLSDSFVLDPNGVTKWYLVKSAFHLGVPLVFPTPIYAADGGTALYLKIVGSVEASTSLPTLTIDVGGDGYKTVTVDLVPA